MTGKRVLGNWFSGACVTGGGGNDGCIASLGACTIGWFAAAGRGTRIRLPLRGDRVAIAAGLATEGAGFGRETDTVAVGTETAGVGARAGRSEPALDADSGSGTAIGMDVLPGRVDGEDAVEGVMMISGRETGSGSDGFCTDEETGAGSVTGAAAIALFNGWSLVR